MALTTFQRELVGLLAERRVAAGERYVAGGVALGEALGSARISRDIDLFHDTTEAVAASWEADRRRLEAAGYRVEPVRERPGYVEARVGRGADTLLLEWARDSAFRFFPLVEQPTLGFTLHPIDLATNKVLALVGRLEPRDWIDLVEAHERLQPLGYLVWAAAGKDPGFGPEGILAEAARTGRYSAEELEALAFAGERPDPAALAKTWRDALREGHEIVAALPLERLGCCVLDGNGRLYRGSLEGLREALARGTVKFHRGSIGGALPRLRA